MYRPRVAERLGLLHGCGWFHNNLALRHILLDVEGDNIVERFVDFECATPGLIGSQFDPSKVDVHRLKVLAGYISPVPT